MVNNKVMDKILMTIVFLVPEPFKSEVIVLNKELAKESTSRFVSEFETFTPHITIYQAEFPIKNEVAVLDRIKSISSKHEPLFFVSDKPSIKHRFVAMGYKKSPEIENFHEHIVKELNPLREGNIKSAYVELPNNLTAEEQEKVNEFGYPYVMNLYSPHMTIISLENSEQAQGVAKKMQYNKSFFVDTVRVAIASTMKDGVKVKKIHAFALGAKK